MGKWTLNHQDDILRDKIKSLVVGAIKRAKLENREPNLQPTITYESFVEELDAGDSFTATIIDALVKEMADRRTRPHGSARRMISERTAKALRMQANVLHIYHGGERRFAPRRYTADFILHPDLEHSEEDEDDSADVLEAAESSRITPALYDAYAPFRSSSSRSLLAESADRLRSTVTSPRPLSPPSPLIGGEPGALPPPPLLSYTTSTGSSYSLSRRRTIRRPTRTTTMDFNDFTTRRRSIVRQNTETSDSVRAEDSADGTWRFSSLLDRPSLSEVAPSSTHRLGRRFFPFSAWSDPHLRIDPENDNLRQSTTADSGGGEAGESSSTAHQSSSQLWHMFTGRPFTEERSGTVVPRLRRGGQPAPESMFPRFPSPLTDSTTPLPDGPSGLSVAADDRTSSRASSSTAPSRVHNSEMEALDEVSRQLLTPRSISPAGEVFHM